MHAAVYSRVKCMKSHFADVALSPRKHTQPFGPWCQGLSLWQPYG